MPEPVQAPKSVKLFRNTLIPIRTVTFQHLASKPDHEVFSVSLRDIEHALKPKIKADPATVLPEVYNEFLKVFSHEEANKLPPAQPGEDHIIRMQPGTQPPAGSLYDMSRDELKVLKKYLKDNLSNEYIRASSSPVAAPVLFVKKPEGGLWFCVDYCGLNDLTIKNKYPLPLIWETLDHLCKAVYFTNLDIIAALSKIQIAAGEEWKTAFRTRLGLYEYLVMPFGLANASSSFQNFINDVLRNNILDILVTAYVDGILVFSKTLKEHKQHVKTILSCLQAAGLQLDIDKCRFEVHETKYLGLIIQSASPVGHSGYFKIDPVKASAIDTWESPKCVKDVQGFLGFANFYRHFIKDFVKLASLFTALTRKDKKFQWTPIEETAFQAIKKAFSGAPVLLHFDPDKECTVETDASDYVSGAVLSKPDHEGILHPVAFISCRHLPTECYYKIYDKELMAIVSAFEKWRPDLEGSP